MKEPFSLEEVRSSKGLEFVNKSIVNQFAPAEDHGLTLLGELGGGAVEWGAAVYHGSGGEETNRDQDVAGRLVWRPFHGGGALAGLQVGAAATRGETDEVLAGEELSTEARVPFLVYAPGSLVDGGRDRLGLELEWHHGPWALAAELVRVEEDVAGAGGAGQVAHQALYVQATWVLTGEERTWKGVFPERPFGTPGGSGAWQLALRYSELDLDSDLVAHGLVAANAFPRPRPVDRLRHQLVRDAARPSEAARAAHDVRGRDHDRRRPPRLRDRAAPAVRAALLSAARIQDRRPPPAVSRRGSSVRERWDPVGVVR